MKISLHKLIFHEWRRGMTLIEVLVSTSLIAILSLITTSFIVHGVTSFRNGQQSIDVQERAARVMREFEFQARAATEVVVAAPNEFTFYRYFDLTSSAPMQVRFFVDGNQLKVGKTAPVGVAPSVTYPAANEQIDFLVEDITNPSSIFSYFDENGQVLTGAINLSEVNMVGLSVSLDKDPNKPPAALSETTKVNLRNMKRNL